MNARLLWIFIGKRPQSRAQTKEMAMRATMSALIAASVLGLVALPANAFDAQ
jgi:hypothetical protein